MEIKHIDGNLLDTNADLILHQVNCQGAMNSGVAKAIREKWPVVFEIYRTFCNANGQHLGDCLPVKINDTQRVINMFSQDKYGYDGEMYTSYDAVNTCLKKIRGYCEKNGLKTIALPYNMCCCRGGANWDVIMAMIKANFEDSDITIEIWKLDND